MNPTLVEENKAKLLAEQKKLLAMLKRDTVLDSEIPGGRKPKFSEAGSEEGENASEVEQFQNDLSVAEDLEQRLDRVEAALKQIAAGSYGTCVVGGEPIEDARLSAEPTAMTCIAHSK